jgi:hypothetical protein
VGSCQRVVVLAQLVHRLGEAKQSETGWQSSYGPLGESEGKSSATQTPAAPPLPSPCPPARLLQTLLSTQPGVRRWGLEEGLSQIGVISYPWPPMNGPGAIVLFICYYVLYFCFVH